MATGLIGQADKIVFGDERTGEKLHETLRANGVSMNTMRRGAFIEWLMARGEDETAKGMLDDIGLMAERIVKLHAATQPKCDGLPEVHSVTCGDLGDIHSVTVWLTSSATQGDAEAMSAYLGRCLSKPVRRLLAAFDLTDSAVLGTGAVVLLRKPDGSANITRTDKWVDEETICFLVPKAVKP